MNQRTRHYGLLIAVSGLVLFANLGKPHLWDRDEPRNAGCAMEMMQRNDWVVPMFNAELRVHKPVLLYWLIMASYSVFGINEFAARFPSALLGVGSVLLTYEIGRRLFQPRVGVWAGLILATNLMFDVAGRAATPDSVLIFCCTLALSIYVLGAFRPARCDHHAEAEAHPASAALPFAYYPHSWPLAAAMYGVMGLAILAKGPVGLVLPTAVIGMFLLVMGLARDESGDEASLTKPTIVRRGLALLKPFAPIHFLKTCWRMRPLTALMVALAVALPWYIWVGIRTDGAWLRGFLLEHNVGRALRPMEGHAGPGLLYYPIALMVGFFPWSILTIPTALEMARGIRQRSESCVAYVFLTCWVGVYVVLFSIAQTKLPSYVTPCYPALALMGACFVDRWIKQPKPQLAWLRLGLSSFAFVGIGIAVGFPIAAHLFLPGSEWLGVAGLIPLVGSAVCWQLIRRQLHQWAAGSLAASSMAFCLTLFSVLAVEVSRHQQYDRLVQAVASEPSPVAAFGNLEPSWVFYARRPIRFFRDGQSRELAQFLAENDGACVITTGERVDQLRPHLPQTLHVLADAQYFLRDKQLVVLGPQKHVVAASAGMAATEMPR